jgi:hypothetical protein
VETPQVEAPATADEVETSAVATPPVEAAAAEPAETADDADASTAKES